MRMRWLLPIVLLTLMLVACGSATQQPPVQPETGEAAPTEAVASPDEPTTGEETAFPVTIEHQFGTTTIPQAPQRVVVIGYNEQDALFALGIKPLAVRYWYGDAPHAIFPWAEEAAAGATPEVLEMPFGTLNYEAITAFQPDLISGLYSGITEEEYEKLSQIAPTLAQSEEFINFGVPWQVATHTIGQAVGQAELAESRVAKVEAQFAAARTQHSEFAGKSVAVVYSNGDGTFGFYTSQDGRARFFTELGFVIPEELVALAGDSFYSNVSAERLDLLDQDVIVFLGLQFLEGGRAAIDSDPLFNQLSAVKEGRIVFIPEEVDDALQFGSVLSLPYVLERVVPLLAGAVGGGSAETEPESNAVFPVTIEHKFGSTTVPAEPTRVLAIGFSEQDPVLALGVVPVAVREWFGEKPHAVWTWAQDELGDGTPEVLTMPFGELNFETVLALKPDLIVATHSGITEEEYEALAQIAPTLAQPAAYPDFGVPWQEQTRLIGQALGRADEAEKVVSEVEAQIAAARKAHPEFEGKTVAWAMPAADAGQFWVVGANTPPLRFLSDLGFAYPDTVAEVVGEQDSAQISSERLDLLDVDLLIVRAETPEERTTIESNPLFQELAVVREGRVLFFVGSDDPIYGALSFSTALSLPFAVEELVPLLAATVSRTP